MNVLAVCSQPAAGQPVAMLQHCGGGGGGLPKATCALAVSGEVVAALVLLALAAVRHGMQAALQHM
jgi:hypothetical protein